MGRVEKHPEREWMGFPIKLSEYFQTGEKLWGTKKLSFQIIRFRPFAKAAKQSIYFSPRLSNFSSGFIVPDPRILYAHASAQIQLRSEAAQSIAC